MSDIRRPVGIYPLLLPSQEELFGMLPRIDQAVLVARALRRRLGYVPSQGQVVMHGKSRYGVDIAIRTAQRAVQAVGMELAPEED